MFVRDFIDDLAEATGRCDDARTFRMVGDAAQLLTNKGLIDQMVGEIAVCVCGGFVTLPPEVDAVLGVQVDSRPTLIRNQWFTYHLNGTGDEGQEPIGFVDVLGEYSVFREPDRPVKLAAKINSASDANCKVRFYGWAENGERIETPDATGKKCDGFYLPTIYGSVRTPKDVPPIAKIDFASKDRTNDKIDIYAVDPDTNEVISLVATYRATETSPRYQRIRVEADNVVRVKFRRRDMVVRSRDDWVNVDHRLAMLFACRAVSRFWEGKDTEGNALLDQCVGWLKDAMTARKPGGIAPPQVLDDSLGSKCGERLFY
jgi:hypothetical protein